MPKTLTAKDLLVTGAIITCDPSSTLSQALAKLNSSHDAVFVVDKKNELLGVISPYYVMYQTKYPPTTKVRNCLFRPPKLKYETPIWEIARHMVESKVYFLPVFGDDGAWAGIVSVRRMMQAITEYPDLERELEARKRQRRLITVSADETIDDARALLRNGGVSRLPVVDASGKLVGILTRFDLRTAFAAPLSSPNLFSRQGERRKRFSEPIRNYFKRQVVTVSQKTSLSTMIDTMLTQRIGSIVIINQRWQPVGILSYRDILEAMAGQHREKAQPVVLTTPEGFENKIEALDFLERFVRKLQKWGVAEWIEATVDVERNAAHEERRYAITMRTHHPKSDSYVGKAIDFRLKAALHKAADKIEQQARRGKD